MPRDRSARRATRVGPPVLGGLLAVACLGARVEALAGQSFRGWVGSTLQMVELRPLAPVEGGCIPDVPCYEALAEERSFAATQDLSLTAWGFGVQGVSATVLLRGRARLGSELVWPRSDDAFDALLAYGQLVRNGLTVRVGRQEIRSGLGFPSFDGASVAWFQGNGVIRVEGYGGRSLARGLREPAREALRSLDDFIVDRSVLLFGGSAQARLNSLAVTARYQRELLSDRSGLASERGAVDFVVQSAQGRFAGSLDYDFALGRAGKGRLGWSSPFGDGRWMVEASAVRYLPYFSLSTIWGFFEPVAYHGLEARVGWSPSATLGVWTGVGARRYGDTGTTVVLQPLSDHGWRTEVGARWTVRPRVTLDGGYELEWGPGGFLNSLDASVRVATTDAVSVIASVTSFQQIEQYRLVDGRGIGGGVSAEARLTERISAAGGASLMRRTNGGEGALLGPWNQGRAWSTVRVLVGDDPGLANRRRR